MDKFLIKKSPSAKKEEPKKSPAKKEELKATPPPLPAFSGGFPLLEEFRDSLHTWRKPLSSFVDSVNFQKIYDYVKKEYTTTTVRKNQTNKRIS
jgi:hypothetical protein